MLYTFGQTFTFLSLSYLIYKMMKVYFIPQFEKKLGNFYETDARH